MTGDNDRERPERPKVEDIRDAERWIGILHHYGVDDADRMNRIEDRLRALERRGLLRRLWRVVKGS